MAPSLSLPICWSDVYSRSWRSLFGPLLVGPPDEVDDDRAHVFQDIVLHAKWAPEANAHAFKTGFTKSNWVDCKSTINVSHGCDQCGPGTLVLKNERELLLGVRRPKNAVAH